MMSSTESEHLIEKAAQIIRRSKFLIALTGAGISAESGIPTYRGSEGLWRRYRPEELATPEAFQRNPALVWEWYRWRMEIVFSAKPNPAHKALAELENIGILKCIITQNVDGLHQEAGSKCVVELHGSIRRIRCTNCNFKLHLSKPPEETLPRCPHCGSILRPDVVWFGEPLPKEEWEKALKLVGQCDCMLIVGTSGVVMPAALLPFLAKDRGAKIIEVNIEDTPITRIADISIRLKAGEALTKLVTFLKNLRD